MNNKKKVILSSVLSIALCLSLIAGSTFALFTDETEFNIAVTSGDVEILATAGISAVYSAEGTNGDAEDVYLIDENNYDYVHKEQALVKDADGKVISGVFSNGGVATINGANLKIERLTPGDRVDVDINVENKSNVAMAYRYKITAKDTNLAKGMVVTINAGTTEAKSYESLASWTSAWFAAGVTGDAGEAIPVKTISVELPVYAGDEYQSEIAEGKVESVEYTITVEAVQGNAFTENEASVVVYPTINAIQDVLSNNEPAVELEGSGTIDLKDSAIDKPVYNTGDVTISNGSISAENRGFENYGEATLDNITLDAGSASDYGLVGSGADSKTFLNNVEYTSGGGAIGAVNGAEVTVNSGTYKVDSASTSGRYLIYTEGEGSKVVVNGGTYSWDPADNQKRAYVYASAGTTVEINGGTFGKASTRSGYTAGILGEGTVIITGGTFGFDPSVWVADGYVATESNGVWTVTAE